MRVLHATDKALLVRCDEWEDDEWIPKSQVHDDSEVYKAYQTGDMLVTEWIAIQKGWIDG